MIEEPKHIIASIYLIWTWLIWAATKESMQSILKMPPGRYPMVGACLCLLGQSLPMKSIMPI